MRWTKKNTLVIMATFFVFLLVLSAAISCSAQEKEYRITESQLVRWQTELTLQKEIINRQTKNEKALSKELSLLKNDLKLSREALMRQEVYLNSTEKALTDANSSLTRLSKEIKARERRLRWQRNIAYTFFCLAIVASATR